MLEYLQINIVLFVLAGLALIALRNAPARIRFYICVVAMSVWLVPWSKINIQIPNFVAQSVVKISVHNVRDIGIFFEDDAIAEDAFLASQGESWKKSQNTEEKAATATEFSPTILWSSGIKWLFKNTELIVQGLFVVGLVLFFLDIIRYQTSLRRWLKASTRVSDVGNEFSDDLKNIEIRVLASSGPGMATGLINPIIWIDSKISCPDNIQAILCHELTHIRQRDVQWVWFITLVCRLFWWNPLLIFLGRKSRHYMEYSCDEVCAKRIAPSKYTVSLTQIILNSDQFDAGAAALGMQKSKNFNVLRVRALATKKVTRAKHILILSFVAALAGWLSLAFAYDTSPVASFSNTRADIERVLGAKVLTNVEIAEKDMPLYVLTELTKQKRYVEAERYYRDFEALYFGTKNDTRNMRVLGFRSFAALLGEQGRYRDILNEFEKRLPSDWAWKDRDVSRVLAIAYIKLGNYKAAIDLLEHSETIGFRGDPTRVLLTQAYHLNGDLRKSNEIIEKSLDFKKDHNAYFTSKVAMLRLLGKNSTLLNEPEKVAWVRAQLGNRAPQNFLDVKADNQSVPYLYHIYTRVAGVNIESFDPSSFPMSIQAPKPALQETRQHIVSAQRALALGQHGSAFADLYQALEDLPGESRATEEGAILEYIFHLSLAFDDASNVKRVSELIVSAQGVSDAIRARAYYVLSEGPGKYLDENLEHFQRYLDMLPEPNVAADHETLKRYWWQDDVDVAKAALTRVEAFYEKHNVVPDIRILNRFIGIHYKLGHPQKVEYYRSMFAKHYARASDYMYE